MSKAYSLFSQRVNPQSEPIPGKDMVKNEAGGYVFKKEAWAAFERFLVLGSEGGTYYVSAENLTKENALNTIACIREDGRRAVDTIVNVSSSGRAPKNDPAIFALALAASTEDLKTRQIALDNLDKVCRIPTHLFHFMTYVKNMRGFGRGLRTAIAKWYNDKPVESMAFHAVKYQSRDGWSNSDVVRLAHPKTSERVRNLVYQWMHKGYEIDGADILPKIIHGFEAAKAANPQETVDLIREYNLTREMVSSETLKSPEVWEALLEKMPLEAMIRNLGNMSKVGLVKPLSDASKLIRERLSDQELLKKARIHPIGVLVALKIYAQGKGMLGKGEWNVDQNIVDALDDAFYKTFDYLTPTNKRFLIGVDMSGSMMGSGFRGGMLPNAGSTPLAPCEIAASLAMAVLKTEKNSYVCGFAREFRDLNISSKMRLDEVIQKCLSSTFGSTDCAVPMIHALKEKLNVDAFVVITDNDTYIGRIHPSQALNQYRERTGINAKQVVLAVTAGKFTIADPKDRNAMDIAGFDTSTPSVISDFIRG